ncbi:hypothetical protein VMCG_04875 [Cytospora schulzeri]|uniref:Gas1-like protein n=1 Tax=Cytospora schulzeri TaxID=448051 RepID=A0A423WMZ4_9PEZI|nr:hypothetical protein VMCG_04875 [Valsa malicola]
MAVSAKVLLMTAFVSLVHGHAQILNAQGESGSPASIGFQVDTELARNCTSISPCQQDSTLIRDAEIESNIVNECGRTELSGNIDVGENTEDALAANSVTQVKAGSKLTVTIHQVNADGAGPFTCDMDPTGNTLGATGQTALEVTNNVPGTNGFSQAKTQDFNITVTMPTDLNCTGASTGNVCTIRCRNNALAGPFGGCFAVQQTDTDSKVFTPSDIETATTLDQMLSQVQQDQKDLPAAVAANQNAGSDEAVNNLAAVTSLLHLAVTSKAAAVQTATAVPASGSSASSSSSSSSNDNDNSGGNRQQHHNHHFGGFRRWARRDLAVDDEKL